MTTQKKLEPRAYEWHITCLASDNRMRDIMWIAEQMGSLSKERTGFFVRAWSFEELMENLKVAYWAN